jgi:hypothetical protein
LTIIYGCGRAGQTGSKQTRVRDRRNWWLALCAGSLVCAAAARLSAKPAYASLRLLDLTGRQVQPLQETRAKAIVFLFVRTDCPVSNRYAPEIRRLHAEFVSSGVVFWLVYVDPSEPAEAIRKHLREYDYPLGALRDPRHSLVKITGARVTPEAAVFVPGPAGPEMAYRGRIDDRYVDFGKARPAPTTRDLERVLQQVIAGKHVPFETIPAVGCFISDLK